MSVMNQTLKYSSMVFLGGVCYGVMATTTKLALENGFTWQQAVASQPYFGMVLFFVAVAVSLLAGKRLVKISRTTAFKLFGLGTASFLTSVLYNCALPHMSASLAITLLFQYTWMGVVLQVIVTRKKPRLSEVVSALVIIAGTICASGVLSADLSSIPPTCIFLCLLSAVSMAIYMHLSGRTANDLPPVQRGMTVCFGACLFATVICPDFFVSGVVERGIWKYGFILGAAGLVFPVILFGIGAARISTGLATIMASSELPAGILMTVIVLGESLDALRVFGIIAIMLGVVIAQLPDLVGERKEACLNMSEQALF